MLNAWRSCYAAEQGVTLVITETKKKKGMNCLDINKSYIYIPLRLILRNIF